MLQNMNCTAHDPRWLVLVSQSFGDETGLLSHWSQASADHWGSRDTADLGPRGHSMAGPGLRPPIPLGSNGSPQTADRRGYWPPSARGKS